MAILNRLEYRFTVDALIYQFKNQRRLASGKVFAITRTEPRGLPRRSKEPKHKGFIT